MTEKENRSELYASFNIIRVGKTYRLTNFGETAVFEVLEIIDDNNCVVRDPETLEAYHLQDLIRYGKGEDFYFEEI